MELARQVDAGTQRVRLLLDLLGSIGRDAVGVDQGDCGLPDCLHGLDRRVDTLLERLRTLQAEQATAGEHGHDDREAERWQRP